MTDLEITKLCAEAIGIPFDLVRCARLKDAKDTSFVRYVNGPLYDPLHNDAQAMALVKKFGLGISKQDWSDGRYWVVIVGDEISADQSNLNRAICECVAKMEKSK